MGKKKGNTDTIITNFEFYGQKTRGEAKEIHRQWQLRNNSDIDFLRWLELPHLRQDD